MEEKDRYFERIEDILDVPKDYYIISQPKFYISTVIRDRIVERKSSLRKVAKEVGLKHPQIVRITSGQNYNMDTFLRILDGLDLEIVLKPKESTSKGE